MSEQDRPSPLGRKSVPGIKDIIGIASGKGGVGKSTVSVNLACALQQQGARVGLLDADMYGPSIPMMMNAFEELEGNAETKKLIPINRYGVQLISIGFLNPGGDPIIWRGPIVSRALQQLINDPEWGELDYLLVDLPPGTGDAPLTLAQAVPLSGVVIVFTPQDVALNIASKSLAMFQRPPFEVPILGMVENMSGFICPHCHHETAIFGDSHGGEAAKDFGVALLGKVPLSPNIAESGDLGKPIVVAAPDSPQGQAFKAIGVEVAARIKALKAAAVEKKPGAFVGLERLFSPRKKTLTPATGLTATATAAQITLRWTAAAGAAGYNVKRSSAPGGPYATIGSNITSNSFVDASVAADTTYFYVVSAVGAAGESANSEEARAALTQPR
ncbi:MAG TPA: P-loop NTPase [Armatimonadota bacterium]|nr:P-loop NTPase [Armatimonadota bacterium]